VHIPFLVNIEDTYTFLQTVDVYAHGRLDGEVNSQAIAEAMYFGKPIVSHLSKMNNGHVETIGNAGVVVSNSSEYAQILQKLLSNKKYYGQLSADAKKRFKDGYSVPVQMEKFEKLFEEVYKNPFPNKIIRRLYSLTNYAYIFARNVQLFVKYKKWKI
jgi:glycosyltransferase involved in cell wall biosynthesis